MRTIGITVEKTFRMYEEIDISDKQFENLVHGTDPVEDVIGEDVMNRLYERATEIGDVEYDYAITDDKDRTIIDWN